MADRKQSPEPVAGLAVAVPLPDAKEHAAEGRTAAPASPEKAPAPVVAHPASHAEVREATSADADAAAAVLALGGDPQHHQQQRVSPMHVPGGNHMQSGRPVHGIHGEECLEMCKVKEVSILNVDNLVGNFAPSIDTHGPLPPGPSSATVLPSPTPHASSQDLGFRHQGPISPYPSLPHGQDGMMMQQQQQSPHQQGQHSWNQEPAPYWRPTTQPCQVYSMDRAKNYTMKLNPRVERGFFLADGDWTCYRRNYFQLNMGFSAIDQFGQRVELPCLVSVDGRLLTATAFLVGIGARTSNGQRQVELVQHTPKRDKGPQLVPEPRLCQPQDVVNGYGLPQVDTFHTVTFDRLQFKAATANNGKRRAAQQYHILVADLFAEFADNTRVRIAYTESAPLVVRGRAPGHYASMHTRTGAGGHEGGTPGNGAPASASEDQQAPTSMQSGNGPARPLQGETSGPLPVHHQYQQQGPVHQGQYAPHSPSRGSAPVSHATPSSSGPPAGSYQQGYGHPTQPPHVRHPAALEGQQQQQQQPQPQQTHIPPPHGYVAAGQQHGAKQTMQHPVQPFQQYYTQQYDSSSSGPQQQHHQQPHPQEQQQHQHHQPQHAPPAPHYPQPLTPIIPTLPDDHASLRVLKRPYPPHPALLNPPHALDGIQQEEVLQRYPQRSHQRERVTAVGHGTQEIEGSERGVSDELDEGGHPVVPDEPGHVPHHRLGPGRPCRRPDGGRRGAGGGVGGDLEGREGSHGSFRASAQRQNRDAEQDVEESDQEESDAVRVAEGYRCGWQGVTSDEEDGDGKQAEDGGDRHDERYNTTQPDPGSVGGDEDELDPEALDVRYQDHVHVPEN
ncbi:hypothetical protein HKX48_007001 [Thoreauomyces humboldtii]|nr:hypothetical protein HKX48_007001 [Thoreauomyces humboldtii]